MKVLTDILTGAKFNDYEELDTFVYGDEDPEQVYQYQAPVCAEHAREHNLKKGLSRGLGVGECGVVGCQEDALHFYEFNVGERGVGEEIEGKVEALPELPMPEMPTPEPIEPRPVETGPVETEEGIEEGTREEPVARLAEVAEEPTIPIETIPSPRPTPRPRKKAKRVKREPEAGVVAMID